MLRKGFITPAWLLAAFLAGPTALSASFNGMASADYHVPYDVLDGGGNTANSASYRQKASFGEGEGGINGGHPGSANYGVFPGFFQRLPTRTASPTPTSTITNTYTASPTPTSTITNTFTVSPTPTFTITNTYTASPTPTFTASPTNSPSPTMTSTPFPVLLLNKSLQGTPSIGSNNQALTFNLSVSNTGNYKTTGIFQVVDQLDPNLNFVSAPGGTFVSPNVIWSLANLNIGQSVYLTLTTSTVAYAITTNQFSASCAQTTAVSNIININAGTPFTFTSTITQTFTVSPTPTFTASPTPTATSTFTASPTNTFTASPTPTFTASPTNTFTVSPTSTFTASPTNTFTVSPTSTFTASPTNTFTASPTYTFTVSPTSTYTASPTPTFTVSPTETATGSFTVSPTSTFTASPTSTASPTATPTPLPPSGLAITMNGPALAYQGYPVTYQLVVTNGGPGPALGMQIYDVPSAGTGWSVSNGYSLQYAGYSKNDEWRTAGGSQIAIGPFNLASGQAMTLDFAVDVPYTVSGDITNTASAVDGDYPISVQDHSVAVVLGNGAAPSATDSPTVSPTFTLSLTASSTPSLTIRPSSTPSPIPSFTSTPVPNLVLVKSANRGSVSNPGDTITWVLSLFNAGGAQASGVALSDTLPASVTLLSAAPAVTQTVPGLLNWPLFNLNAGATQAFTFTTSFNGGGATRVSNQGAASAANNAAILSNAVVVAVGATFTNTPSFTASPSATPSPSQTPTALPTLQAPHFALTMTVNQGDPWPHGVNLGFSITFENESGCACAVPSDVYLTFYSDTTYGNTELDAYKGMIGIGLAPPNHFANYYWTQMGVNPPEANGIQTGPFTPSLGVPVAREVFAEVEGDHTSQPITSMVVLTSQSYAIAITVTVITDVVDKEPPTPTITPTPVASLGKVVAYPQPAKDTVCIAYNAPKGGPLVIEVYNVAFERVARITDQAQGGRMETACVPISRLPNGVYLYKTKVGDYEFPMSEFGVSR